MSLVFQGAPAAKLRDDGGPPSGRTELLPLGYSRLQGYYTTPRPLVKRPGKIFLPASGCGRTEALFSRSVRQKNCDADQQRGLSRDHAGADGRGGGAGDPVQLSRKGVDSLFKDHTVIGWTILQKRLFSPENRRFCCRGSAFLAFEQPELEVGVVEILGRAAGAAAAGAGAGTGAGAGARAGAGAVHAGTSVRAARARGAV